MRRAANALCLGSDQLANEATKAAEVVVNSLYKRSVNDYIAEPVNWKTKENL
jgi:hypothetical protein